jgi:hypothetical protein
MSGELSQLPWDQLQRSAGGIPWPALHALANAVAADAGVAPKLFEVYDRAYEESSRQPTYADFYVAAIFALAAPKLDDERRREIGAFLVERMVRAGRDDMDISLEALEAAAGTIGPVLLPAVLDAIEREPDAYGAWFHLWGLTALATKTQDEAARDRVIQVCVALLERADRGEASMGDAGPAAWTLASLQRTEYTDLLQRLSEKPLERFWPNEYEHALKLLQDRLDHTPVPEIWEQPVEEWLTSRCKMVEESAKVAEHDRETEKQEDPDSTSARLLATGFVQSPVATALPEQLLDDAQLVAERLVYFSLSELDTPPARWDESALREILLDIVPRRLLARRELLEEIVPITEALLYWLQFEGMLADADALAQTIHSWSEQIVAAGLDPHNWGSAKATVMKALDAGLDFRKPEVREALLEQSVGEFYEAPPELVPSSPEEPPIPIVERSTKPARNAPCPCGSGKKYKKCHGRPGAEQTSNL